MAIIIEEVGNIFSAPPRSILIHACNARGAWGSGVAIAFKQKYPHAFRKYNAHCLSPPTGSNLSVKQHQANIVGTALLIAPPNTTHQLQTSIPHYIACLFTSLDYGKRVSPAEEILENTRSALKDLAKQVAEMRRSGEEMGKCYAVRINSGKFGVEWQKTKAVLEAGDLDIKVVRPEEEERADVGGAKASGWTFMKGDKDTKVATAKAESLLDKQMVGFKRKFKADVDEDGDSVREYAKGKQSVQPHPGFTKRKKLGLDG